MLFEFSILGELSIRENNNFKAYRLHCTNSCYTHKFFFTKRVNTFRV